MAAQAGNSPLLRLDGLIGAWQPSVRWSADVSSMQEIRWRGDVVGHARMRRGRRENGEKDEGIGGEVG
jgi:hypothetical protein